jgi:hypothetical protein
VSRRQHALALGEAIVKRTASIFVLLVAALALSIALPAAARAEDTTPPQMTSFSISPSVIDTESAPQTLTITMTLTDDQSGVALYTDPDIQFGHNCWGALQPWDGEAFTSSQILTLYPERIVGTPQDAVYVATVTLPAGARPGAWRIPWLQLADKVGNLVTLSSDDLEAQFGARCATVTNTAKTADTTPPRVTALSFEPSTIDTATGTRTLTATVGITDDQSGVATSGDMGFSQSACALSLRPLTTGQVAFNSLTRQSGNDHVGVYTIELTLPRYALAGIWQADILVGDKAGNVVELLPADLETQLGADYAVVDNVAQVSDGAPPQVRSFSITPSEVDTETGDQTVTLDMELCDDLSGVSVFNDQGGGCSFVELRPLIGSQVVTCHVSRVSGDDRDGMCRVEATLPEGAKEGLWQVGKVVLYDKVGNLVALFADDLHAALPDADLFFANTATAQQVTIEQDWTLSGDAAKVTFPAGTVVTRLDGGRFAFYQMTAQEFTLDDNVPTTNLDGVPVATLRFGIPGLNVAFSQPVTVSMQVGSQYDGYLLDIQSLTEGGEAWANEKTVGVANGRCSFTVSHATRFAASLATPTLTKFTPASGKRGATITITGKGFGKKHGTSLVKFGATKCAKYVSWSATRIRCKVPAKAKFGKLKVRVVTPAGPSHAKTFTVKR